MLKKILISLAAIVVIGALATYLIANYQARQVVDERISALVDSGQYDQLSYETLNVAPDGSITMTNLLLEQDGITAIIESIIITDFDYAHELPWHMDIAMSGFRLPDGPGAQLAADNPVVAAWINQSMQIDTLPLQVHYQYAYDQANDDEINARLELAMAESFDFSIQSVTRKIALESLASPDFGSPDPAIAMEQISAILAVGELPSTTMILADAGLVESLLQAGAESGNTSVEDFRTQMISQARNFYLFAPQSLQAMAMQTGSELATFLEGGKTLQVNINPEFGGNFQKLQPQIMGAVFTGDFNAVIELLNLEISTR